MSASWGGGVCVCVCVSGWGSELAQATAHFHTDSCCAVLTNSASVRSKEHARSTCRQPFHNSVSQVGGPIPATRQIAIPRDECASRPPRRPPSSPLVVILLVSLNEPRKRN